VRLASPAPDDLVPKHEDAEDALDRLIEAKPRA
jgi:hypothetical protein